MNIDAADEVKTLIAFYEARGWDWLLAAEYTLAKANGGWPLPKGSYIRRTKVAAKEPEPQ